MTVKELSQLYYLDREIKQLEERLSEMECYALGTTSMLTGMPGNGVTSDKTAIAADIADLKELIARQLEKRSKEWLRLTEYIESIDDSLTRQVFYYRFVRCLKWNEVADRIGGFNTEDSVKKICYRYIKGN